MNAMEMLIRNSMTSLRHGSQVSLMLTEAFREGDDFSWSWGHLKSQFEIKKAEHLFHKYQARLQHSLLVLVILINLLLSLSMLITNLVLSQGNVQKAKLSIIFSSISLMVYFVLLSVAHKEHWFRTNVARTVVSIIVLFTMCLQTHGSAVITGKDGIRPTYYVVLVNFIMLPYPKRYICVIAGIAVMSLELITTALTSKVDAKLLAAEGVFYVAGASVGFCIRFIMEMMNRRAFLDRRECLESKIKLQFEKHQEESLLKSVLPDYLAEQVKNDIRQVIIRIERRPFERRPFNELYIGEYKNVSILYADIVNSMKLAARLEARELVETLNELFARFDDKAEKNHCLRVKLLGDCYYCVSGVPNPDPDHSDNTVQMGLDMIEIISTVRDERQVPVDMRIGIHTGRIMCGLIGSRKWQYDIYSKDALIASHMEHCGKSGHVHITDVTYGNLKRKYRIEIGEAHYNDTFIINSDVRCTYFISPIFVRRESVFEFHEGYVKIVGQARRASLAVPAPITRLQSSKAKKISLAPANDAIISRKRFILDYSITQFRTMISNVNADMEKAIEVMALSKKDQWCNPEDIEPICLTFLTPTLEKRYRKQPDPLFKYYLLCILILFCGTLVIHTLVMDWNSVLSYTGYPVTFGIIAFGNFATWSGYLWLKHRMKRTDSRPRHYSELLITRIAHFISNRLSIRIIVWFLTSALMLAIAMAGVENLEFKTCLKNFTCSNNTDNATEREYFIYYSPWYYTFNAALAMTTTSVFLKIHFILKLFVHLGGTALFSTIILSWESDVFENGKEYFTDWEQYNRGPAIGHCYYLIILAIFLHMLDRQIEYVCRLDFIWKHKLWEEKEEAQIMGLVNRMLLTNILPEHIANYYLTDEAKTDELYYEEYGLAAVMFASIPEFSEFYSETDMNEEGRRCLQVLNEIICDFDELLYVPSFTKIEKIKTIGSTYMAAAGLHPGRGSRESVEDEDPEWNVINLIKFATAMMEKLAQLNRDTQQDFRLRIGVAVGSIIAGVVGQGKPQYDIWGDTVNLASRMDSTGIVGRIQITKEVAEILRQTPDSPYICESRGEIFVKGKGMLTTYLLKTAFDSSHSEVTKL